MEAKLLKTLDGVALNLKRKRATRCVVHLTEVLAPQNVVVKQMRLVEDVSKPNDPVPSISRSLVRYYLNYKKSGMPKRLMFYKNGEWLDYPEDVVELVKKDFEIKKAAMEVELDGQDVVLDFLHMYHLDLKTGLQQPIAWIDEAENYFFPEVFAGSAEEPNNIGNQEGGEIFDAKESHEVKLRLSIEMIGADKSKLGEYNGDSNAATKDVKVVGHDFTNKMDGENVVAIKKEPTVYLDSYTESTFGKLDVDYVQKMFLTGMAAFGITESNIVEIYRNSDKLMQKRLELFQKQADITKGVQGDANVRYAWLPCSKEELSTMMKYGLGYYGLSPSKCVYGFGVHLAAATNPYASSLYCDVDENGIKYLVLCRVIMGNMELLRLGSCQNRPSGYEYDNGVDDNQCPKCYVVWNMNMNTHIYLEFVVRFKTPLDFEGNVCSNESKKNGSGRSTMDTAKATSVLANTRRPPSSLWLSLSTLLDSLRNMVPPQLMFVINAHHTLLMSKKISLYDFMRKLKSIVGDKVLRDVIYSNQFKGPPHGGSNGSNK